MISSANSGMEKISESTSRGKKLAREQEEDDNKTEPEISESDFETLSLEQNLTFSYTLIALRIMRAQFPVIDKVTVQPFILRSQLYSCVKDRTQVDREIESLKKEKKLRVFKLNTGQDDHGIMFTEDYLMQCLLLALGGKVKDAHITVLINAGLLTRQLVDSNMYWFAIPNIGSVLKSLLQGRKELLSFLSRRKYKEMLMAPLEMKRFRMSMLDTRFHLRDLIGSGHLKTFNTPTGLAVRISKD
ncbi:serine/threonine-protein kinase 19-like isoform X2 [Papaver somniferum]|uniref:serine/threonine-protein kinase 19-like isoform X2 n=1 Tax=Papaver somniferum TaxID=3469 RepID=UPI000E6FCD1B|nr:serine/threonine-protein kinase 19-like isoform X2 [Papaver somniferum]